MSRQAYEAMAVEAARKYGIPEDIFLRQIAAESAWNPNAVSHAGAAGLMQFMPGTAEEMGVDPYDPASAIDGGARYLRQQYDRFGDWGLALASYNSGPGNVEKYGGIPPFAETRGYIAKILGDNALAGSAAPGDNALAGYGQAPAYDMNALAALVEAAQQPQRPAVPQFSGVDTSLFRRMT